MAINEYLLYALQSYYPMDYERIEKVEQIDAGLLYVKLNDGRIGYFSSSFSNYYELIIVYRPGDDFDEAWKYAFSVLFRYELGILCMRQYTLSDLTGIPKQTLSAYAVGKTMPSAANIAKIAKVLRMPSSFFIDCLDDLL